MAKHLTPQDIVDEAIKMMCFNGHDPHWDIEQTEDGWIYRSRPAEKQQPRAEAKPRCNPRVTL